MQPKMHTNTFIDYKCKYLCLYIVGCVIRKIWIAQ